MTKPRAVTPAQRYEQFFVPAIFGPWARVLVAHAAPGPGQALLDLACGTGVVARTAAPLVGPSGRVTALDLRPGMLAVAKALLPPEGAAIEWIEGDATDTGLPDQSFDHIVCQAGFQFFPDKVRAAREARRTLKDEGQLTLLVWQSLDRHPVYAAMAQAEIPRLGALGVTQEEMTMPFCLGNPAEVRTFLEKADLREIEIGEETREVRFPEPERFVHNVESAYAAIVPEFAADPAAFQRFLDEVEEETRTVVASCRQGDWVVFPMHALIATARR